MITIITGHINEEEIAKIEELKAQTKEMKDCKIIMFPENRKHPKDIFKTAIRLALNDDEEKDDTIIITFSSLVIEAIDVACEYVLEKKPNFYLKGEDELDWINPFELYHIYDNLYEGGFDECDNIQLCRRLPLEFQKECPEADCC